MSQTRVMQDLERLLTDISTRVGSNATKGRAAGVDLVAEKIAAQLSLGWQHHTSELMSGTKTER